ncbi:MAG: linear amide C-N hydrolase [Thermomicrobiales bacterium]|jgi:choloylglycine hydrolase|nr:linear amide C-N hydrolase [Thermomicrobiales bacterium]
MCTRVLWNDNDLAVLVGRTMDWPTTTEPILTVLPRGLRHDGGMVGPARLIEENPLTWRSRYGSVIVTVYGMGAADGVNEAGLAAHLLYLTETDFGPRDTSLPGLQAGLWAQYLLDNAATVEEAIALHQEFDLMMAEANGRLATVHMALEDASGDSAIIEYIDGKAVVHHGRAFTVMTNSPTYDQQLAMLAEQDFSNPSSETPLPGNVNAIDRFQRASYYRAVLPEPSSEREGVASILAIVRNTSVPFGAPYKEVGVYNTEYRTVSNLTDKRYYFELSVSPSVIWIDLNEIDFSAGAPVLVIDPDNIDLSGDVTSQLQPTVAPF